MKRCLYFSIFLSAAFPLAALAVELNSDLSLGNRGENVRELQKFLAGDAAIYPEGIISGYFGLLTKEAVIRFQKRENITPALGYVGPKTRRRVSELSAGTVKTPGGGIADLMAKLEDLRRQLAELQNQASVATSTPPVPSDSTPPQFIEGPNSVVSEPDLNSPFGISAPVKAAISWKTNEPSVPVSFSCNPTLAVFGLGLDATYWAMSGGKHDCALAVEDPAHNQATSSFSFNVPAWFG